MTLTKGLTDLDAANQAVADFLEGLELDLDNDGEVDVEAGDAIEADVAADLDAAVADVDALVAGDYTNSSTNVRAALLADQQEANATALTAAQKTLADAEAEVAKVAGLEQAVANLQSAEDALTAAQKAEATAAAAEAGAVANFNSLNDPAETLIADIVAVAANGEVAGLIELNADDELELVAGVTEADNEGVTALLNAINARLVAEEATADAGDAVDAAQEVVDNLDLTAAAKTALTAVATEMGDADATPSVAEVESEIAQRYAELKTAATTSGLDVTTGIVTTDGISTTESQNLLDAANAVVTGLNAAVADASDDLEALAFVTAAGDNLTAAEVTAAETALDDGIAALNTAIGAITYQGSDADTLAVLTGLTTQAFTDGFISATDKTAIDNAFGDDATADADYNTPATLIAAITDSQNALTANNEVNEFDVLVSTYNDTLAAQTADLADAEATATAAKELDDLVDLLDDYITEANTNDRVQDLVDAQDAISNDTETGIQDDIDALAEAVAELAAAQANADQLEALNDAIDAAEEAFTDNDYLVPVTVDGAELATAESDIFLAGETDGSIANFSLLGDDVLFVSGATYNSAAIGAGTDEVALDEAGNDAVVEFFLEETGAGVDVIVETTAFGSSAATAEVVTITLTGVELADITVDGGFITVA